jgi:hypothetical protein
MVGSGLAALTVVGAILYLVVSRGPDSPEEVVSQLETPENVVEYLGSEKFGDLSVEQRAEVLEELRRSGKGRPVSTVKLDEQELEKIRKNVAPAIRKLIQRRVETYHALPEDQKTAYLDGIIDEIQERMANGKAFGRDGEKYGLTPEQMKQHIESSTPEERAQQSAFQTALFSRMLQRGFGRRTTP